MYPKWSCGKGCLQNNSCLCRPLDAKNAISWSSPLSYWMENNFDNVFCELNFLCYQFPDSNVTVWIDMFKKRSNCLNMCYFTIVYCSHMGWRSRVTWLCCQLIARPGSVTTVPLWPDPFHLVTKKPSKYQSLLITVTFVCWNIIMYCRTYIMFIIPLLNATLLLYVLFVPMFIGR